jgi:hypothetical protein
MFGTYEVDGELWGTLFPVDPELEKLENELAELDSAIFNFSKTHDLRGPASKSLDLMRERRASLENKISTYKLQQSK